MKTILPVVVGVGLALAGAGAAARAQESAQKKVKLAIQSETLADALAQWADQTDLQLISAVGQTDSLSAPQVKGRFTPQAALDRLLAGTPLTSTWINERTVAIRERTQVRAASDSAAAGAVLLADGEAIAPKKSRASSSPYQGPSSEQEAAPETTETLAEIIVTGTHIRGVVSPSPKIVLDQASFQRSGYTAADAVIRSLPQNFSGGVNPQVTAGNAPGNDGNFNPAGASSPNLRGLGASSTLTLVNGRRVAQGLPQGGTDVSSIPLEAIDHVDVVTDSASAIYGADAVAGVVNFVLKSNLDGAKTSIAFGRSTQGGGLEKRIGQLFGKTWSSGDAMIAYEHARQDAVDVTDRDFTSSVPAPYSLLPEFAADSVFLSMRQSLGPRVVSFFDGSFVSKDNELLSTDVGSSFSILSRAKLQRYSASTGLRIAATEEWEASISAGAAQDKIVQKAYTFTPGQPGRDPFPGQEERDLRGKLRSVELGANGPLMSLPGGDAKAAVGAGKRWESFDDAIVAVENRADGERSVKYLFGELSIPLVKPREGRTASLVDLTLGARYESYSDFGSKTVPKVGVVISPMDDVSFRGSWSKAFRAPSLDSVYHSRALILVRLPDGVGEDTTSVVLARDGGNRDLQPETATAWNVGVDFTPEALTGLKLSLTYFDIEYKDRIAAVNNIFGVLLDPVNAPFVIHDPSASFLESLTTEPNVEFVNFTDEDYDPAAVMAVVENRLINVSSQSARGADLALSYQVRQAVTVFADAAYLDLHQKTTSVADDAAISGTVFNPPKYRARVGATLEHGPLSLSGILNYIGSEKNIYEDPAAHVASWSTVDATLAYSPDVSSGALSGIRVALAVQNLFDKDPPFLRFDTYRQGINFDSLNASPLGRFVSLQFSKEW